jgi:uncharacterized alpha-E superfamily protein
MLSRTAENLYWLARYVERAESTARLIEMGRRMALLPCAVGQDEWRSVIRASGASVDAAAGERQTEFDCVRALLLSPDNPSSIRCCLARARANGRAVRTALTQDMWEVLNEGWRRLDQMDERTACRDLPQILDWVERRSATFRGTVGSGLLRNDGYDFMQLGSYVERADMMLRLLDVKYYVLLPETEVAGGGRDHHQWTSVLHANSAIRAFHHVYRGDYSPWKIADFLILNADFPRSLAHSYQRIGEHLEKLARRYGVRHSCHATANDMIAHLSDIGMGEIFQRGLHEFVAETIGVTGRLSNEIGEAYHF